MATAERHRDAAESWFLAPVPQSLIHMTLILCVLTFMYVSAKSVADYKSRFLDPLIDDLHVALIARNRYRASTT